MLTLAQKFDLVVIVLPYFVIVYMILSRILERRKPE